MRKIALTLLVACLLTATTAAQASANEWGGRYYHGRGGIDPFWPITWPIAAALAIPAAIIGTVANVAVPEPAGYVYAAPPAPAYAGPAAYYAPGPYYAPRVYVAPRGYYYPRRGYYYSPRVYYPARYYRVYRGGW